MCRSSRVRELESDESTQFLAEGDAVDSEEEEERNQKLAKRETKQIGWLRLVVLFVLVAVATLVCVLVYFYTTGSEEQRFESAFDDHSSKVIDAFRTNAARRLAAIGSLSMAYTSHAIDTGAKWPNVTLPDYERKASRVMDLAAVVAIFQFPLITAETREQYEAYALDNQGWLPEGLEIRQEEILRKVEDGTSTLDEEAADLTFLESYLNGEGGDAASIPAKIYRPIGAEVGPEDGPGPYFPVWQFAPAVPLFDLVNFNAIRGASHTKELEAILERERVVTSRAFDFSDETDPNVFGRKPLLNLILNRWKSGGQDYEDGPVSDLYYPIYDSFNITSRKLVAVFDILVYWQVYFVDILPPNANGVVVVLENTCGQNFSYEIDGPTARYMGAGDLHDPAYNHYMRETGFGAFLGPKYARLEGLDDNRHCYYNVKIYPSKEMEDQYASSTPIIFTIVLVCVFAFTSFVFVVYDRLVERRQTVVMETAVKSTEVVEQLFPAEVRQGLYNTTTGNNSNHHPVKRPSAEEEISKFLEFHDFEDEEDEGMPNAHLYPECTVFFADIAGFTKWSSGREAGEVFKLLELLYKAFDKVAKKRNVFKVETIGDCYMAVTGCPKPQSDHAVRMAKFAHECQLKMSQMRPLLAHKLGPETADLAMRIGMHSGSVTGGVLRGQKARFQLFGDTVNTASRMESNGKPWQIQASSSTADLIEKAGKGAWLRLREDKIEAKGKGMLQTYWIEIRGEGSVVTTQTSTTDDSTGMSDSGGNLGLDSTGPLSSSNSSLVQNHHDSEGEAATTAGAHNEVENSSSSTVEFAANGDVFV